MTRCFYSLAAWAMCWWCLINPAPQAFAAGAPLVADIAERVVEISYSFSGAQLLVFGAAQCEQNDSPESCDLIAVIEGPQRSVIVREKARKNGLWVNAQSARYDSIPGYYAYAATRPLSDILTPERAQALGVGLENLTLAPSAPAAPPAATAARFQSGLIGDKARQGLFVSARQAIIVREGKLFRMSFPAPATVPTGDYTVSLYALSGGDIIGQTQEALVVRKAGFEAFVTRAARDSALIYGVVSVLLALVIGFVSASVYKN